MLVTGAHRGVEALGKSPARVDRVPDHDAAAGENHREAGLRQQPRGLRDRALASGRALQAHDRRQLDVDLLGPEVPRDVDLCGSGPADRVLDHPVEHLRHPGRVAHLFLVADHLLEQRHLRHFLESALADGLVGRLGGYEEHRGVVPVGGLHRGHEVGNPGAVLADAHRDLAGGAGVAVAHEAGVALVRDVPEGDPGLREEVGYRHEGGADDAEDVLDAVPLENLHEGFFSRHSHRDSPLFVPFPSRARARGPIGGGCYHPGAPIARPRPPPGGAGIAFFPVPAAARLPRRRQHRRRRRAGERDRHEPRHGKKRPCERTLSAGASGTGGAIRTRRPAGRRRAPMRGA